MMTPERTASTAKRLMERMTISSNTPERMIEEKKSMDVGDMEVTFDKKTDGKTTALYRDVVSDGKCFSTRERKAMESSTLPTIIFGRFEKSFSLFHAPLLQSQAPSFFPKRIATSSMFLAVAPTRTMRS